MKNRKELSVDELEKVLDETTKQIEKREEELGRKLTAEEFNEELDKFSKKKE